MFSISSITFFTSSSAVLYSSITSFNSISCVFTSSSSSPHILFNSFIQRPLASIRLKTLFRSVFKWVSFVFRVNFLIPFVLRFSSSCFFSVSRRPISDLSRLFLTLKCSLILHSILWAT
uniref:Uncharacterized protein n=1 Tax=Cacopsylla melanoneura TaxID=428564 RepID=A0A8D8ZTD3_9HEMI